MGLICTSQTHEMLRCTWALLLAKARHYKTSRNALDIHKTTKYVAVSCIEVEYYFVVYFDWSLGSKHHITELPLRACLFQSERINHTSSHGDAFIESLFSSVDAAPSYSLPCSFLSFQHLWVAHLRQWGLQNKETKKSLFIYQLQSYMPSFLCGQGTHGFTGRL